MNMSMIKLEQKKVVGPIMVGASMNKFLWKIVRALHALQIKK